MIKCPWCAFSNPDGFRFCGNCGRSLHAARLRREDREESPSPSDLPQERIGRLPKEGEPFYEVNSSAGYFRFYRSHLRFRLLFAYAALVFCIAFILVYSGFDEAIIALAFILLLVFAVVIYLVWITREWKT